MLYNETFIGRRFTQTVCLEHPAVSHVNRSRLKRSVTEFQSPRLLRAHCENVTISFLLCAK